MCGIVFAGSNTMGVRDVDFFETLLYMDIIRGDHSTGVFAGFSHLAAEPLEVRIRKAAVPADVFIRRKDLWAEVKEDRKPSVHNPKAVTVKQPKFLVGHNRYATMGEVVDRNAHPFQHGSITLVHNGTLDNQSLLPDHTKFAVDSENVAYSIDKIGIEETIKKLHGKFTLVWFDAKDQTLNFIRNKDRPFHFMESSTGDWFGASEEDMIMWLSKRPKGITAKRHFEAEVGTQYVFDCSNGGFRFKEERKHELPVFRYSYYNGGRSYSGSNSAWYNDYDDDEWERTYNRGSSALSTTGAVRGAGSGNQTQSRAQTSEETQTNRINRLLSEHNVHVGVGEWLFFESFQFDEYPNGSKRGKMTGFMGTDEYIEVQAPGTKVEDYTDGGQYRGKIISAYEMNYILHIIVGPVANRFPNNVITISELVEETIKAQQRELPEEEVLPSQTVTQIPAVEEPEESTDEGDHESCAAITANGELVTKKEWDCNGALNCCANCGSPIPWADAEVTEIRQGNAWCQDCAAEVDENGYPKDSGSERPSFYFMCKDCGMQVHEDMESYEDKVCTICHDAKVEQRKNNVIQLPAPRSEPKKDSPLVLRKLLQNRMIVTREQWSKMCTCSWCHNKIDWKDAEETEFNGQRPLCQHCSEELERDRLPKPKR